MITIYGASDDLVEVDGCDGADEFYVASVPTGQVCWHGNLVAAGATEQVHVQALYDGCWHFSVGQVDEEVKLPRWPLRFEQGDEDWGHLKAGPGYSVVLLIDAPAGTRLANVWPEPQHDT
jgi:hypothetical protein